MPFPAEIDKSPNQPERPTSLDLASGQPDRRIGLDSAPAQLSAGEHDQLDGLNLDSTYFVAFEMGHRALKLGLAKASPLNITQYRALMKLLATDGDPLSQKKLGEALGYKPNVLTQALGALSQRKLIDVTSGSDARTRYVRITEAGKLHVDEANKAVALALYEVFPTTNPTYRTILEAAIAAGSAIDPPLVPGVVIRHPASRALVSIELIRQETERALKEACGASFNECRVLQRLCEAEGPLRISTLAADLDMSAVNVARAANRLEDRGWIRRLGSDLDKKAVFAALTEEGTFQGSVVNATVNDLASTRLWANLAPDQRDAISKVGHVVVAELIAQKEHVALAALKPL